MQERAGGDAASGPSVPGAVASAPAGAQAGPPEGACAAAGDGGEANQIAQHGELLFGRYQLAAGPPLGVGGWFVVRRAADVKSRGRSVALKTFNEQAARDLGSDAVLERFTREVEIFRRLGVGPVQPADAKGDMISPRPDPRRLLVNLLDYSRRRTGDDEPGPAADGRCYTVLELADEPLDVWLKRRSNAGNFVAASHMQEVATALADGLAWLHKCGVCHLDIKLENILHFGSAWKLIDLDRPKGLSGAFSPLYASPELARFALDETSHAGMEASPAMDMWATGVVMLDILVHGSSLEETKAGFDAAALFDEEDVPFAGWYRWLAETDPLDIDALVPAPASSVDLLRSADLREVLGRLLDKDPERRLSARELRRHAFLSGPGLAARCCAMFRCWRGST